MGKSENASLILPASITYLSAIRCFISELATTTGLPSRDIHFLLLAVEEVFTHVIEHAFLPDEGGTLEIICEHTPLEFTVKIRDKGLLFDPSLVQRQEASQDMEHIARPGMGFRPMESSVDEFSFHNLGSDGKEIVLTKFMHQKHIKDYFSPTHLERFEDSPLAKEKPLKKIPFQVQFLNQEQAIEVAQCAYRTYGYTYILENVYYPERLAQMIQTGDIVSAVAVSEVNGEVMAHCALEFHGRKHTIPEIAMAFTKPKYRGMGCLNSLNDFILDYAQKTGLKGMYAKAVTAHTYSQKALDKFGFHPCGLLVGHSPPKEFTRMEKRLAQRETLVLYHRKISEAKPMRVHIPQSHRKIIEEIFHQTGVAIEPEPEKTDAITDFSDESSHLECYISNRLRLADLYINRCGKDLEWVMDHRLKELCQKKIEAITVYLDLTDPGINKGIDILERQNCFFVGLFPAHPRPFLILQYLNNVSIDYDQIALRDDFARELFDYVKNHDPEGTKKGRSDDAPAL